MRLHNMNSENEDLVRQQLAAGVPLVLKFDEATEDGRGMKGFLLVDALGTAAGTRVTVRSAQGVSGRRSLAEALSGNDKMAPLAKGDTIAFASSYVEGGIAMVGQVAAHTHDAIAGPVQVMTAMARPSQSKVTKKGASQYVDVADGANARVAREYEDVAKVFDEVRKRDWPGGSGGFLLRGNKIKAEYFEEPDCGIDYLLEELKHAETLEEQGDAIELVPIWRLPMGRDQVTRDVDPRKETGSYVSGPFTRLFEDKSIKGRGFVPCLLVIANEEEWAFGGRTGKTRRAAIGVQPVFRRTPVEAARLPTCVRAYGGTPNTILALYSDVELQDMARKRDERCPKPQAVDSSNRFSRHGDESEGTGKLVFGGRR